MDIVLQPHHQYAAAYLDVVAIHSSTWTEHLHQLRAVLGELLKAGLTVNPWKCYLGLTKAQYMGYCIRRGLLRLLEKKIKAMKE